MLISRRIMYVLMTKSSGVPEGGKGAFVASREFLFTIMHYYFLLRRFSTMILKNIIESHKKELFQRYY